MSELKSVNVEQARKLVDERFDASILPTLEEYIRIPNKSPMFDAGWAQSGHMDRAVALLEGWARDHALEGMTTEVVRLEGRTPVLFMEVPGQSSETVLLYGHLDKQPEMTGWSEGLGPWTPVRKGERLYGRGGADDGYALFSSLTALSILEAQGIPHARCVILIEASEESGSPDLPAYIDVLADRIGSPNLIVCLDSGCGDYERLWCTTSLRGIVTATLTVEILEEGVHSGEASGIVASTFRIARQLLSRIEHESTGSILPSEFQARIPEQRIAQARKVAEVLGKEVHARFPLVPGARPVSSDPTELLLNGTWRPALSIVGAGGLPPIADAGNVLRPKTELKLSLRLPPITDHEKAIKKLKEVFETDPPYGARVTVSHAEGGSGWNAPPLAGWLETSLNAASRAFFGKDAVHMGEGGSIPFMAMLGKKFPEAQFMITGLLGPGSNAHGPNEFLHIPTAKALTGCVARVVADHFRRANA